MLLARAVLRTPPSVSDSHSHTVKCLLSLSRYSSSLYSRGEKGRSRPLNKVEWSDNQKICRRKGADMSSGGKKADMSSGGKKADMSSGGKKASTHSSSITINPSSLVNCHLQVIGTGSCEMSPSFCLFTDSRRYIFNCGENFQRFTREYRMKILKEPMLFITRVSWRNLGGLPGFAMSYRDSGKTHLRVHGPGRIAQFAEVTRYFIGRERLKLVTNGEPTPGCTEGSTVSADVYSDENVTITTVELEPQSEVERRESPDAVSSLDDDDVIGGEESNAPKPKRIRRGSESPLPASTAAFICKLVDTKGKFNPERARELGLKKGPIYKRLVAGESVTAPDGRVIHPSDVIGAKQIGPTFIVVECPNKDYISSVVSNPKLQSSYFSNLRQELALIVHLSPLEVLQDDSYCRWVAEFGESTRHLVLNESVCLREVGLRALMKIQYPLYLMNSGVHHPPPSYKEEPEFSGPDLKVSHLFPNSKSNIIIGRAFLKFLLKPVRKMGQDSTDTLRPIEQVIAEHVQEIQSNPKLLSAIAAGQSLNTAQESTTTPTPTSSYVDSPFTTKCNPVDQSGSISPLDTAAAKAKNDTKLKAMCMDPRPLTASFQGPDDAIVTFLGTGASLPSRYRNVSGILVQTPDSGNFLLDCGEGSLSQIYRCFPQQVADSIVLNLKVIFISHIHGDHHLGLVSVLQKKENLLRENPSRNVDDTVVIAPKYNINWMTRYTQLIENLSYRTVDCSVLTRDQEQRSGDAIVRDFEFETVPVVHCSEAYGVLMRHSSGWSIVYSGDTRPCPALIEAGRGASLLIHEATLEDGLLDHAIAKKHCTVSEALEVSDKMNPNFTILTHFSQRYPKIPSFLMADQLHSRVAIAFDCMSVSLKQLNQLHKFLPAMRDIFAEVVDTENEDSEYMEHTATSSSWEDVHGV